MPQLNLYVNQGLVEQLKQDAAKHGESLSQYVTKLLTEKSNSEAWPEGYFEKCCGFLGKDDFPEIDDSPPESCVTLL